MVFRLTEPVQNSYYNRDEDKTSNVWKSAPKLKTAVDKQVRLRCVNWTGINGRMVYGLDMLRLHRQGRQTTHRNAKGSEHQETKYITVLNKM